MPEHNPKIIPGLLGKPLLAVDLGAYRYEYIFIPSSFSVSPNGAIKINVLWQHWPLRPGNDVWPRTDTTFNKYSYEVLNADFSRTGTVFRPE